MALKVLLLVLLLVPMLGGLNYVRNEPLDNELRDRTYAGINDTQLAQLADAYRAQLGIQKSQVQDAPEGIHQIDRYGKSDVGGKAEGFENFQHRNREWRDARGKVMEAQATLDEIEREKKLRARGLHTEWGRILRRVTAL